MLESIIKIISTHATYFSVLAGLFVCFFLLLIWCHKSSHCHKRRHEIKFDWKYLQDIDQYLNSIWHDLSTILEMDRSSIGWEQINQIIVFYRLIKEQQVHLLNECMKFSADIEHSLQLMKRFVPDDHLELIQKVLRKGKMTATFCNDLLYRYSRNENLLENVPVEILFNSKQRSNLFRTRIDEITAVTKNFGVWKWNINVWKKFKWSSQPRLLPLPIFYHEIKVNQIIFFNISYFKKNSNFLKPRNLRVINRFIKKCEQLDQYCDYIDQLINC